MTLPHPLPHLGAVAGDYDILLCDVWGVIHNGRESWPTACQALTRFNQQGGHVVLISNSPRPATDVIAQLDGLGVPRDSWKAFVTSGDATRAELAKRAPGPAWIVGPSRDDALYAGLDLDRANDAADAAFISVHGPVGDEVYAGCPKLKVVVRFGIGYDTIDVEAATRHGVMAVNVPDYCIDEVSDHAIGLWLALGRKIVAAVRRRRSSPLSRGP